MKSMGSPPAGVILTAKTVMIYLLPKIIFYITKLTLEKKSKNILPGLLTAMPCETSSAFEVRAKSTTKNEVLSYIVIIN